MLLTFEKIREVQLNEKKDELQALPENFFDDAADYLRARHGTDEGKTALKILTNLFERRLKKVANMASIYYLAGKVPDNLSPVEVKVYSDLISALRKGDCEFRARFADKAGFEDKSPHCNLMEPSEDASPVEEKEKGSVGDMVKVTFVMDTPELMTPDMQTCTFKKGDCATVSKAFADFLKKSGFCSL
ncbi:MAG: DNA replication complex GINS family protein [Candidatus Aenigmarchaeota archaeon]|nr:DNA replication complex GINS family protein [Candidatus Aenigmarchaeota archaeon]